MQEFLGCRYRRCSLRAVHRRQPFLPGDCMGSLRLLMVSSPTNINNLHRLLRFMRFIFKQLVVLILLSTMAAVAMGQTADDDEVNAAYPGYPHTFYSGYLKIGIDPKPKSIHYVFFPSLRDQSKDPVVVWLTGGPGCSSLLACFHQNGPFTFEPLQKLLKINDQTWNKKANLLYLELPAGVGFSDGPEDQIITDGNVTTDAMYALRLFFARFPAYKKNQLYFAGHGYASVFITNIAKTIIEENNDPYVLYNDDFNLKGILLGNPCMTADECFASGTEKHSYYHYQFLYNRGYFTTKTWNEFRGLCVLNYNSPDCYAKRVEMDSQFNKTNSSMYNIYSQCYKTPNSSQEDNYINTGCEDDLGVLNFLNNPNVKKNWNIDVDKEWQPCNKNIFMEYLGKVNAYQLLPFLIKNHLRIWIFTGDLDAYIPIIGTKKWVEDLRHELEMPVKRIWREWWVPGRHKGEDQVGGFIWELRDLTLVTVKGAGFRAAYDQPEAMSEVLSGFLDGKTLPFKNV